MRMDNLNDLFLHGLKDIYDAEHRLLRALGQLAKEARDPAISGLFEDHRAETEEQIGRLEECFEMSGAKPRKHACTGIIGILEEHKSFKDEKPAKEMLAAFDMGAALRTEHYEIATYKSLISMAECLGAQECSNLLKENLRQEEAMAQRITEHAPKVLDTVLPEEEHAEAGEEVHA